MASKTATTNRVTVISHDEMTEHLQLVQRTRNGSVFTSQHFSVVKSATFHIEDALEAMAPLRFHFMYVALVTEGRGEAVLNMQPMSVGEGDLFFANYGTIVGGGHTVPYLTYNGFSLTEEYLHMVYGNDIPGLFLDPERCLKARLTVAERTTFNSYLTTLLRLLHLPERDAVAVRSLFTALLNFVCSLCECHCKEQTSLGGGGKSLQLSFYQLVRKNIKFKRDLSFYASSLFVTPHYLSILVKRDTGQPAKEWIEQALVSMLQADLKYSDKTIKALVTEYNFPSMSSFSRFFKRRTGMSPREFRQKG